MQNNKEKGADYVEKNFEGSIKELKWHLIKEQIVTANDIKIEDADLKAVAKEAIRAQFAQYGMSNVPDDVLENYAAEQLKKRENVDNFVDRAVDMKLTEVLKNVVKLNEKEVTLEDFNKLLQEKRSIAFFSISIGLNFRSTNMIKNDFRKYATQHLGMDGLTLDDVMKAQAQYLNPYILEERQLNVTQMDVFSRLMMDRIIFLGTQIDDYTANTLQAQLLYLDSVDSGKDISIYINSPGGSVTAGLGIYDTMQFISSDVATICTGMAASMGAVLLVAGTEGKRSALPHSRVMIHQPLGGVQGQASDIEIEAKEILKFKKELYTIISDHSHTPYEKVYADSDRNYWMTAEEAKEYGMIDTVLTRKK